MEYPCDISLELPCDRRAWCEQLRALLDEGALATTGVGVACSGAALVKVCDGKWADAKTVIENRTFFENSGL